MQKNKTREFKRRLSLILLGLITSCSPATSDDSGSGTPNTTAEADLCTTSTTYTSGATVTGTATFSKRGLSLQTAGSPAQVTRFTLSNAISTNLPIRFAEVRVLNSSGQVVQCGKTNTSGQLKALDGTSNLSIPATAGTYTIEVLSRANHTMDVSGGKPTFLALFSVKEDIYSNAVYKITSTISSNGAPGSSYPTTLNATALESVSSKIEGGAFNIYNDIITSYDYLANNTGTQNLTCLNSKVSIFWKAGFNPNQYIYPTVDPASLGTISYYLRTDKELYINGGILGNVSTVDTDHFDDSVIIHELGHHIENVCSTMDSPGGAHNGAARIDPRLAWSEGWGNFFGAHIIRNNLSSINPDLSSTLPSSEWLYYVDTEGYTSGGVTSGYEYIKFNLARPGNSTSETIYGSDGTGSYEFDRVYTNTYPGESHFREVSISRGLFKVTNTCSAPFANCVNQDNFNDLWKAFEKNSTGMGQSIYPFRGSAKLLERFKAVKGGSLSGTINNMLGNDEALQMFGDSDFVTGGFTTWVPYGVKLVPSVSACPLKIQPKANDYYSDKSDQRHSNHFYTIDKNALPGVTAINLNASYAAGTSNVQIDMLVFVDGYRYNEDCNAGTCSRSTTSDVVASNRTSVYPKAMAITSLSSASYYLLNIRAYTPGTINTSTEYTYTLTDQNGGYLCPSSSY